MKHKKYTSIKFVITIDFTTSCNYFLGNRFMRNNKPRWDSRLLSFSSERQTGRGNPASSPNWTTHSDWLKNRLFSTHVTTAINSINNWHNYSD